MRVAWKTMLDICGGCHEGSCQRALWICAPDFTLGYLKFYRSVDRYTLADPPGIQPRSHRRRARNSEKEKWTQSLKGSEENIMSGHTSGLKGESNGGKKSGENALHSIKTIMRTSAPTRGKRDTKDIPDKAKSRGPSYSEKL